MKKQNFGIVSKSIDCGVLMDENTLCYELWMYRNHIYRIENGKITKCDMGDVIYVNNQINAGFIKM